MLSGGRKFRITQTVLVTNNKGREKADVIFHTTFLYSDLGCRKAGRGSAALIIVSVD